MASYWIWRRFGFLGADITAAVGVMLFVGLVNIWLGAPAAILATAGLATVAFMRQSRVIAFGGAATSILRTQRLLILSSAGKPRACLDDTGFQIIDEVGRTRILLAVDRDGPALQICDEEGKLQLSLGSAKDRTVGLSLVDQAGQVRARTAIVNGTGSSGVASFCLYDQTGQLRGHLSCAVVEGEGSALLALNDAAGNPIWSVPGAS